ncbi:MAG TPA: DUF4340 domain-containing protein [Candidatus Mucispirillum faecigallinarum]|uniref:DUF4340 domain-containing protein n=1 Tax=Candidatus Mucispirillum faecigallinarum TaxID=2838699 RepID=A0A9D2GU98_9BACT|nr:DUF4340 domain-containing protein [Candidatus Mucispirillum faecigallinarum]
MLWANVGIILLVLILASIYFLPYRRLKGKVFKKLLPDPAGITAMEYRTSAYSLQLEKRQGVWYVIDSDWEADKAKVTKLLNRLRDLTVDERVTGSQDDPEFNIGSNGYLILNYDGQITTISIGNRVEHDEDYVYITKSGDPDILVVHSGALSLLPKDVTSFSDTVIFEAFYPQIKSIEASLGNDYFTLHRTENGWMFEGKTLIKEEKAQSFIEKLLAAEALGFVEEEIQLPQRPTATITVKVNRRGVIRYFFEVPNLQDKFLMPLKGRILYVDKNVVKDIFAFTGK